MKGPDNAFLAMVAFSLLIIFNISTFIKHFNFLNNKSYEQIKIPVILGVISVLIINYLIFIHRKKYVEIEKRFINETKRQIFIGNLIISIYTLLTFVFLFWVFF